MSSILSSYLFSALFWLGLPLGALGLLLLYGLVGGAWGKAIFRELCAISAVLPYTLLLFLPALFFLGRLYPWAAGGTGFRGWYLTESFFIGRFVVIAAAWCVMGRKVARQFSAAGDPPQSSAVIGPASALWVLTVSFFAVDWVMSLEPEWYSSIYGLYYVVTYPLFAFAVAALIAFRRSPQRESIRSPEMTPDLGNLALALISLWAYVEFSQFLIIWSGDLPEEITWYHLRAENGWLAVLLLVVVFHLVLPLGLLLFRRIKRDARLLAAVLWLVAVMRVVSFYWWAKPAMPGARALPEALDVICFLTFGLILAAAIRHRDARWREVGHG